MESAARGVQSTAAQRGETGSTGGQVQASAFPAERDPAESGRHVLPGLVSIHSVII